jgi:hypothetical protein
MGGFNFRFIQAEIAMFADRFSLCDSVTQSIVLLVNSGHKFARKWDLSDSCPDCVVARTF